jgi:hypothetical protein
LVSEEKHGGNVREKGIVTITSKSDLNHDHSDNSNYSTNELGQWICWDFHEMGVCPTHYTIRCNWMKSMISNHVFLRVHWMGIVGRKLTGKMISLISIPFT